MGSGALSMRRIATAFACLLSLHSAAMAIVGDAEPADEAVRGHAVPVQSSQGNCTGAVLANDLVLTAAHCVLNASNIRIAGYFGTEQSRFADVTEAVIHPDYGPEQKDTDLALLKLANPLPGHFAPLFFSEKRVAHNEQVVVVGYGVIKKMGERIKGPPRMATFSASVGLRRVFLQDQPGHEGGGKLAVCGGDSGAPVFAKRAGMFMLVAIVRGGNCNSLSTATPLAPHHDWIVRTGKLGISFR
jgi:secreted trypsin-like serine protease